MYMYKQHLLKVIITLQRKHIEKKNVFFYSAPPILIAKNSIPLQESISVSQPSPTLLENLTDDALAYLYK